MTPESSVLEADSSVLETSQPQNLAELFKSDCGPSPCSKQGDCGGAGSGDCGGSGDCSEKPAKAAPLKPTIWQNMLMKGLQNTLDIAFDEVRKEPKKILMIGGARQRDFARHLALMLPAADITLIDPSEEETRRAKEEICCRFKFMTGPIEAMPFENNQFDLVLAHNLPEFCEHWQTAYSEIQRVTTRDQGNLMLSIPNPVSLGSIAWMPGFKKGLARTGVTLATRSIELGQLKQAIQATDSAQLGLQLTPMPWHWLVVNLQS